jgi:hypothetical protein
MIKTDVNNQTITVGASAQHEADEDAGTVIDLLTPATDWVRVQYPNGSVQDIESWHLIIVK